MERDEGLEIYLRELEKAAAQMSAQDGDASGREVRAGMIRANLRLVVKVAQEERARAEVSLLDLIAAGNLGLIKAVTRFDPGKEGELAVFARWWISQAIKREVVKSAKKFSVFCAPMKPDKGRDEDLALPA